ncbi:subtilase family protein [Ruminiclostridium sufflavum DSM 19573]|uniref:Subtilase family protein n=1 Tax=Ruminiclostridium sufflavum DSM 19573 TaxID=1121337 RepID=A0A318XHL9_9FIRM|nr:S8 family serine peptidase [Ruminiclostridium sufflavum]PYG84361.1 subtilase family protein [Ruminiclostridium sufflavum DSM 19573]
MDKLPVNIAVIDDGISEGLYGIGKLEQNIQITPELRICQRTGYDLTASSHGTTCAAIIRKYAPEAVLSSVKILGENTMRGMKEQLVEALDWCVKNNIKLINLSLGTIDFKDFNLIKPAVDLACESGIVIVAACNNRDIYTCPASLPNVIGVKCDTTDTLGEGDIAYNSADSAGIEITAYSKHKLTKSPGIITATGVCNSYAAPLVTACVHNILREKPCITFKNLLKELEKKSCSNFNEKAICRQDIHKSPKIDIDIPILAVYNFENGFEYDVERELCRLFRKDGYNAIYACNDKYEEEIINGIVSINSCEDDKSSISIEGITRIYTVYDPDIIIAGINLRGRNTFCRKEIELPFETDIKIFTSDIFRRDIAEMMKESKAALLLTRSCTDASEWLGSNIFKYSNEATISELYCHILKLFEKDEKSRA